MSCLGHHQRKVSEMVNLVHDVARETFREVADMAADLFLAKANYATIENLYNMLNSDNLEEKDYAFISLLQTLKLFIDTVMLDYENVVKLREKVLRKEG